MTAPLPRPFAALTGANLAAQSAEQLSLAAVPLVAVLLLGAASSGLALTTETWPAWSMLAGGLYLILRR